MEKLASATSKLLEALARDGVALAEFTECYHALMEYYQNQLQEEIMKVSKKPAETIKDGTPFLLKFVKDDLNYLKLAGNNKRALYSVYDPKVEKLNGFAATEDGKTFKHAKDLREFNLGAFA